MLRLSHRPKPIVLCILDGWGVTPAGPGNAITLANPANFNSLWFSYPHCFLQTSGQSVGLPQNQVGNSEVGHLNLGAGRIVLQDLLRINMSIADGSFYEIDAFLSAIEHIETYKSDIHLMGLVGPGGVHSETDHLWALLSLLQREGVDSSRVKIHLFTDGRDSPPTSAKTYIDQTAKKIKEENLGQISSVCGRYYAMDRDNRWDRTGKAYFALLGRSIIRNTDPIDAIEKSYSDGKTDEFMEPVTIINDSGHPVGSVKENDAVIFFNFRPDRTRQLAKAFVFDDLSKIKTSSGEKTQMFDRGPKLKNIFFVTLTRYEAGLPVHVAFKPSEIAMPLARLFAERGMRQLHIAETEKYAHVTYFFNGGREQPFNGEDRILIDSQKVASYDLAPEMRTPEVTKKLVERVSHRIYDFIVVNLANADMVGHTGNIPATIKGIQTIDDHLGVIAKTVLSVDGGLIITSDHGNAEEMINPQTGQPDTEHNANPAPCIIVTKELQGNTTQLGGGLLADVTPTMLGMMHIPKPSEMTGRNLLE